MRPFLPSGEATCETRSYSRIMRGPDCFERSCPCPQAGVEPGRRGRREVEGPAWMLGEPLANLWKRMDQMPARDKFIGENALRTRMRYEYMTAAGSSCLTEEYKLFALHHLASGNRGQPHEPGPDHPTQQHARRASLRAYLHDGPNSASEIRGLRDDPALFHCLPTRLLKLNAPNRYRRLRHNTPPIPHHRRSDHRPIATTTGS